MRETGCRGGDRALLLASLSVLAVATVYVWILSAGAWWPWHSYDGPFGYFDAQASAFLRGQAHLPVSPHPALLALPDPYDPKANAPYRLHDAVLWKGRYYLYWGPVPALLLCPLKLLPGVGPVHDKFLVFGFAVGSIALLAATVHRAVRRLVPRSRPSTVVLGILAAGLACPMTFTMARSGVYEAAILGGQFFAAAALYLLVTGLEGAANLRRLALGGACLAAAAGCRATLLPAGAAVVALTALHLAARGRREGDARSALRPVLAVAVPFSIGCALLAGYNWIRFGSVAETGIRYALTGHPTRTSFDLFFSWRHVGTNLVNYFFLPPRIEGSFPYLYALAGFDPVPATAPIPGMYPDHLCGVFAAAPFCWLAVFGLRLLVPGGRAPGPSDGTGGAIRSDSFGRWIVGAWATACVLALLPILAFCSCSMRYVCDFWIPLAALSIVGAAVLLGTDGAGSRRHRVRSMFVRGLVLATVLAGLLLSVTGYYEHFRTVNPRLLEKIRASAPTFGFPDWAVAARPDR